MTKQDFLELLERYAAGQVTQSERLLVERFYARQQEREQGWEAFSDAHKTALKAEIYRNIASAKNREASSPDRNLYRWAISVAASIVLLLTFALHLFFTSSQKESWVTKSTGKGQKASITLSDGSVVRLNAESSITYPQSFSKEDRTLSLQGEAYFEVVKDKSRPFIVTSYDIQTTVLGTAFNVNAYDSAAVAVALVHGLVKVATLPDGSTLNNTKVFLTPGEMARFDEASGALNVSSFDSREWVAWKDGVLYLKDAGYRQVFERLTQWYGVQFEFVNSPAQNWEYSGEFKDMSLQLVLETISFSKKFQFQINQKTVRVQFENPKN